MRERHLMTERFMQGGLWVVVGWLLGGGGVGIQAREMDWTKASQPLRTVVAEREINAAKSALLNEARHVPTSNQARRERLLRLFREAGAARSTLVERPVRGAQPGDQNVMVLVPGTGAGARRKIIVIGAHTDVQPGSSGAIDNWSGSVVLAALYEHFRQFPVTHTLVFVGFASEEHGLKGSQEFIAQLPRKTKQNIIAMVNLECLGVGDLRTWINQSADMLERSMIVAGQKCHIPVIRATLFGYTADSFTFDRAGIPSMTVHSLGPRGLSLINSPADDVKEIKLPRIRQAFQVLATFLHSLGQTEGRITGGDSERHYEPARHGLHQGRTRRRGRGVVIRALDRRAPERRAGMRRGDTLLAIRGVRILRREILRPALLTIHRGETIPMTIMRGRGRRQRTIQLAVKY